MLRRCLQVFIQLFRCWIRDDFEDKVHSSILEDTSGFALRIFHKHSPSRRNGGGCYTGKLHGLAIGKSHVSIITCDKQRMISCYGINPRFCRQLTTPVFMVPATFHNPGIIGVSCAELTDSVNEFFACHGVFQMHTG